MYTDVDIASVWLVLDVLVVMYHIVMQLYLLAAAQLMHMWVRLLLDFCPNLHRIIRQPGALQLE